MHFRLGVKNVSGPARWCCQPVMSRQQMRQRKQPQAQQHARRLCAATAAQTDTLSEMRRMAENTQEAFARGNPEELQEKGGDMLEVRTISWLYAMHATLQYTVDITSVSPVEPVPVYTTSEFNSASCSWTGLDTTVAFTQCCTQPRKLASPAPSTATQSSMFNWHLAIANLCHHKHR